MRGWATNASTWLFGSFLIVSGQFMLHPASAAYADHQRRSQQTEHATSYAARHTVHTAFSRRRGGARRQFAFAHGGISCVPFAREDSGIAVSGNAWQWWENAAGVYARGKLPEPGSVLAFRANGRMHLGHVAVVARVVNPREVEIDHANWWGPGMRGGVARSVPVVDVSEANDWSAVRVGLGGSGEFGSVYPTYGFIYNRPDTGVMEASAAAPAPKPELNPAPSDLRPKAERGWQTYEEVAEAPVKSRYHQIHNGRIRVLATVATPSR